MRRRRKKKMSEVWWDAHIADKGINSITLSRANKGDTRAIAFIERYNEATIRTYIRRLFRKKP